MSNLTRNLIAGLVTFSLLSALVVLVAQADGREISRATSNDGGAWLVDRRAGGAAHIEWTTRRPTSHVLQVSDPGSPISVMQSPGVVAVLDRGTSTVRLLDQATARTISETALPQGVVFRTAPDGAVAFDEANSRLWALTRSELAAVPNLVEESPGWVGGEGGRLLVSAEGSAVVALNSELVWPGDEPGEQQVVDLPEGFQPEHLTMAGRQAVAVAGGRWVIASPDGSVERELERPVDVASLQAESVEWPLVGAITETGQSFVVDVLNGSVTEIGSGVGAMVGVSPAIFHESCLYTLGPDVDGSMLYRAACLDGTTVKDTPPVPAEAELKLVNGQVWIDALDGSGYLVSPDLELDEIADFSDVFEDDEGEESADGTSIKDRLNQGVQDAALTTADNLDLDDENEPPVAVDDEHGTRLGRPAAVDVLANDSDPDGDVLLITGIDVAAGADLADIEVTPDLRRIQVSPTSVEGTVQVDYTIADGRGGTATARLTVEIRPVVEEGNRPPTANLDRVIGSAGSIVSANLLTNDHDPDGDSLALAPVTGTDDVSVVFSNPNGDVVFSLPQAVDAGTVSIPYVVTDEWGASAEGAVEVTVRLSESNAPPDARNDAGTTQVGNRLTLDLLANDVDGDGDILAISRQPEGVDGETVPGAQFTSDAGEFTFEPTEVGTFLFEYTVTDGQLTDTALIRIEVTEPVENRPPVAVRDDVTLSRGETRLVRSLLNDGDPDGDLLSIVGLVENPNLSVEVIQGVGFRVKMGSEAGPVETLTYRVSDGLTESRPGSIVVTRSERAHTDSAPIAIDDMARVRSGRTSQLSVLGNDFDPEGGPLLITEATTADGVTAVPTADGRSINVDVPDGVVLPFSVQYTVADEAGNVGAATVRVGIVAESDLNQAPIARFDTAFTTESEAVVIDVLANDSDPESDPLSLASVSLAPVGGALSINPDGPGLVYRPRDGFSGTDRFTYLVRDSEGAETNGHGAISVTRRPTTNTPPVANDDPGPGSAADFLVKAGVGTVNLAVLANDTDLDGDPLTVISVTGQGVSVPDNGLSVSFEVPQALSAEEQFTFVYEIADGRGGRDSASATVTVLPDVALVAPIAAPDVTEPVAPGQRVTVDVLVNDRDPDGERDMLRVVTADQPSETDGRRLTITAPQATTQVAYTIEDGDGLKDSSFVTVVVAENLPPIVENPIIIGDFFTDDQIPQINLADHVTDPDNGLDELVFSGVSGQVGGTTKLDRGATDQRLVGFEPAADFAGEGGFSFVVDDGANMVSGRVTIILLGLGNNPPVGVDVTVEVEAGVVQPFDVSSLFVDPDDDTLSFAVASRPSGDVSLDGAPPTYRLNVPITASAAQTEFSIKAVDPEGLDATATVTVTVNETSAGPPVASPDIDTINQGERSTRDVLANDINTLGDGRLTLEGASVVGGGGVGTASVKGPNLTFVPNADFFGEAQIEYVVADGREGEGGQATGLYTVTVIGRPDAPTGVVAQADGPRAVVLSWNAPDGNGAPVGSYRILVNGVEEVMHNSATPQLRLDDRVPGIEYVFEVQASNVAGESPYSNPSKPVTPDQRPGPPGTPVAMFVKDKPGAVRVTWADGPNEGSAITEYQLEISQCGSGRSLALQRSFEWTGLPNGQNCSFRVVATNLAGESQPSPWSAQECAVDVPGAAGQPTVVRGDKQAMVSWNPPPNPDCKPLGGYELTRFVDSATDGTTGVPFGTTRWNSSPLLNGETYTFSVKARNRQGWGPDSVKSAAIVPCGVPTAPSPPSPTDGTADGTLNLNPVKDAGSNGCTISQWVMRVNNGSEQEAPADNVVRGLTNGQSYTIVVAGVNEVGTGQFSSPSAPVVPYGLPGAPQSSQQNCGNSICVTFSGASDNGSSITGYQHTGSARVQSSSTGGIDLVCRNNKGQDCLNSGVSQKSPPTGCLQNEQTIGLEGWAINAAGAGARTARSVSIGGCPGSPTLDLYKGDGKFTAEWSRPSRVANLYLQIDNNYGSPRSGTSATISATNGRKYTVVAWACNRYGCTKGPTRTVTPGPPAPTLNLSRGGSGAHLAGCTPACEYVNASGKNWTPNSQYWVRCHNSAGDFVNTKKNIPVPYRARYIDGSGNFYFGDGICASDHSHHVTVWTSAGDSVTGTVAKP